MELFFLGCGGGRVITDRQTLATGGFRVHAKEFKMHVDPGPGALVKTFQHKLDPVHLNAIFVSHAHVDHCNDAGVLVEAMTFGMYSKKKGLLLASECVLEGGKEFDKQIDRYFLGMLEKAIAVKPGQAAPMGKHGKITGLATKHEDPTAIGFKLEADGLTLAYTADTENFEGMARQWESSDFVVVNCLRPDRDRFPFHLSTDEVIEAVNSLARKPTGVFLSHAGEKMIRAGREAQRAKAEQATGVRFFTAEEGLRADLSELASKQRKLSD